MFMFHDSDDTSFELTLPSYVVDVQSILASIELFSFTDEFASPETAVASTDLIAVDVTIPLPDPLVPDAGAVAPITVADLAQVDPTVADTAADVDAAAVADAVASALAALDGSFFDLAEFSFGDFGPFS